MSEYRIYMYVQKDGKTLHGCAYRYSNREIIEGDFDLLQALLEKMNEKDKAGTPIVELTEHFFTEDLEL